MSTKINEKNIDSDQSAELLCRNTDDSEAWNINQSERSDFKVMDLIQIVANPDRQTFKKICQQWQYKPLNSQQYQNHSDMICIAYNYCFMKFEEDETQYLFKESKFVINFREMTEVVNNQLRSIRLVD